MKSKAILVLLWMTALCGLAYPLLITSVANIAMPFHAQGSMIYKGGKPAGSRLIAQKFSSEKYFWARPSAINYNPLPSGGSQLSATSLELRNKVRERELRFVENITEKLVLVIPSELLYASGSGVDPHISVKGAYFQVDRILKGRKLGDEARGKVIELIDSLAKKRSLGFLGDQRVNVLELNMALDNLQVAK